MKFLPYFVYAVNSLSYLKDSVVFFCECVYEGYTEKHWVFTERNTYPVMLSSSWRTEPLMLTYDPATFTFGRGTGDKMGLDIVTVELKTPSTTYDMSSFLYSVKWYSTGSAPSLYELVLLFLLHEKICLSTDMLSSYTLVVMTSDAVEYNIEMNSPMATQSFRGFTEGLKVD